MTKGNGSHELRLRRIERAQALGAQHVLDPQLMLPQQYVGRTAVKPRQRTIGIERQRTSDIRSSAVEIVTEKGDHISADGEHERVVSS